MSMNAKIFIANSYNFETSTVKIHGVFSTPEAAEKCLMKLVKTHFKQELYITQAYLDKAFSDGDEYSESIYGVLEIPKTNG